MRSNSSKSQLSSQLSSVLACSLVLFVGRRVSGLRVDKLKQSQRTLLGDGGCKKRTKHAVLPLWGLHLRDDAQIANNGKYLLAFWGPWHFDECHERVLTLIVYHQIRQGP